MYRVFRQLENGELVHVAWRDQLEQVVKLVEALSEGFPGEYVVAGFRRKRHRASRKTNLRSESMHKSSRLSISGVTAPAR